MAKKPIETAKPETISEKPEAKSDPPKKPDVKSDVKTTDMQEKGKSVAKQPASSSPEKTPKPIASPATTSAITTEKKPVTAPPPEKNKSTEKSVKPTTSPEDTKSKPIDYSKPIKSSALPTPAPSPSKPSDTKTGLPSKPMDTKAVASPSKAMEAKAAASPSKAIDKKPIEKGEPSKDPKEKDKGAHIKPVFKDIVVKPFGPPLTKAPKTPIKKTAVAPKTPTKTNDSKMAKPTSSKGKDVKKSATKPVPKGTKPMEKVVKSPTGYSEKTRKVIPLTEGKESPRPKSVPIAPVNGSPTVSAKEKEIKPTPPSNPSNAKPSPRKLVKEEPRVASPPAKTIVATEPHEPIVMAKPSGKKKPHTKASSIPISKSKGNKTAGPAVEQLLKSVHRMNELGYIRQSRPMAKSAGPTVNRTSISIDNVTASIEERHINLYRAELEREREEKYSLERTNAELHQQLATLQKRILKEQEKNKIFPKVTSTVPTSLEANIHLRYQFQKALESERERYAALELENERLVLEMKGNEMKTFKGKQVMSQEEKTLHINEVAGLKLKVKELEAEKEKLAGQIVFTERIVDKEVKEKIKAQQELVNSRRYQMHLSDKLMGVPVPSPTALLLEPFSPSEKKESPHGSNEGIHEISLKETESKEEIKAKPHEPTTPKDESKSRAKSARKPSIKAKKPDDEDKENIKKPAAVAEKKKVRLKGENAVTVADVMRPDPEEPNFEKTVVKASSIPHIELPESLESSDTNDSKVSKDLKELKPSPRQSVTSKDEDVPTGRSSFFGRSQTSEEKRSKAPSVKPSRGAKTAADEDALKAAKIQLEYDAYVSHKDEPAK